MIKVISRRSFDGAHLHLLPAPSNSLLKSNVLRKPRRLIYRPAEARFVGHNFNSYKPGDLIPATGDWPNIQELLCLLFPIEAERLHVLNVLAFHAQNPGVKIRHAILIRGPQGSGKNLLAVTILGKFLGPWNVRAQGADVLTSTFNSDLLNCEVLVIDEVILREGWGYLNQLKPLITEVDIQGNAKGKDRTAGLTPRLVFILSNDETPIPLDPSDRRYFVPTYGPKRHGPEFYTALTHSLETEAPAFYAALLEIDVSLFNPGSPPPMTEAKKELQLAVRPQIERQIREWIEDYEHPFHRDIVVPTTVLGALKSAGHSNVKPAQVTKALISLGGIFLGQLPALKNGTGRLRCWAIRNVDHWNSSSPSEKSNHYYFGTINPD